jgi:hypothetical protein
MAKTIKWGFLKSTERHHLRGVSERAWRWRSSAETCTSKRDIVLFCMLDVGMLVLLMINLDSASSESCPVTAVVNAEVRRHIPLQGIPWECGRLKVHQHTRTQKLKMCSKLYYPKSTFYSATSVIRLCPCSWYCTHSYKNT